MAVTVTTTELGNTKGSPTRLDTIDVRFRKMTLTGTYATGGYVYNPGADLGFRKVITVGFLSPFQNGTSILVPAWNSATGAIQLFQGGGAVSTPLAEVAAAASVAGYVGFLIILGLG